MTDHTLELLKKMREEMQAGFAEQGRWNEKTTNTLELVAETLVSVQTELHGLKREVGVLGIAVDAHTKRLDRIEERLGLDNPTH